MHLHISFVNKHETWISFIWNSKFQKHVNIKRQCQLSLTWKFLTWQVTSFFKLLCSSHPLDSLCICRGYIITIIYSWVFPDPENILKFFLCSIQQKIKLKLALKTLKTSHIFNIHICINHTFKYIDINVITAKIKIGRWVL